MAWSTLMPWGLSKMSEASGIKLPTPKNVIVTNASMRLGDDKILRQQVWRKLLPAESWAVILTLSGLIDESMLGTVDST